MTNYGRASFEPGDRVLILKGLAEGQVATISRVYCRHWGTQGCYCGVDTDQGEHHFEKGSNLELLGTMAITLTESETTR